MFVVGHIIKIWMSGIMFPLENGKYFYVNLLLHAKSISISEKNEIVVECDVCTLRRISEKQMTSLRDIISKCWLGGLGIL